jgi:hypothetical protein
MTVEFERSEDVPLRGVGDVPQVGRGKTATTATLHLEAREGPTPPRRVVTILTDDGAEYRFQRYGPSEFLSPLDRKLPDGPRKPGITRIPNHVKRVRRAIHDGEVVADPSDLADARRQVGQRQGATDAEVRAAVEAAEADEKAVVTDGGSRDDSDGLTWRTRLGDAGLTVAHAGRSAGTDATYGARRRGPDGLLHMNNTDAGEPGWLGNPYLMDDRTVAERRRVVAAYLRDFLDRLDADPNFVQHVESLRGGRALCWCRGVSQDRTRETFCHLDVVNGWLRGDLRPVFEFLRGEGGSSE